MSQPTNDFIEAMNDIALLHRLSADGMEDSLDAEAIRDRLDNQLRRASVEERAALQSISEALYSLNASG